MTRLFLPEDSPTRPLARLAHDASSFIARLWSPLIAAAAPARPAPPLPPPSGAVVNVSSESQLRAAASNLTSNTTIVLAPGVYVLQDTVYINGTFSNVGVRGASGN